MTGDAAHGLPPRATRRRWLRRAGAACVAAPLATSALVGCGFEPRRAALPSMRRFALVGFSPASPLRTALVQRLVDRGAQVVDAAQADALLTALDDVRERRVAAVTAAGQVRELRLGVRFVFRLDTPAGDELIEPTMLVARRDLSTNESDALAKRQEEDELFTAMTDDVLERLMRRLAGVKPPPAR